MQDYVSDSGKRGIILAVNSKNDPTLAREGFTHPHSALAADDFASFQAGWDMKSRNMARIAKELNVFTDSFVFIDDNKPEILEINNTLPEVATLSYDTSPVELLTQLDRNGYFEPVSISADDSKRKDYYKQNALREQNLASAASLEDHLQSLNMSARLFAVDDASFERCLQLINKTNQFNPTTRRTDGIELSRKMADKNSLLICGSLTDNSVLTVSSPSYPP